MNTHPGILTGRTALVVGASRGIGAAVARGFARAGASVVVAARDADALHRLVDELTAHGGHAISVPTDVTEPAAMDSLVEQTMAAYGRLDIACNNAAGGGHRPTPLADVPIEAFDSAVAVNLRGVFLAMKYEIPAMLTTGGGAILNMSSTAGQQAVGGLGAYVGTKHGIEGLTKVAALDYAHHGIRVNALAPGPILTDALTHAGLAAQAAAAAATPLQRIGQPDEVAAAAVWICSDQAAFITGTTLIIDGGKLAGTPPFVNSKDTT
jgi:NAD(P)-dependent dehydrogenase (short-subunit alcohol dehydrogenase family)